MLAIITGNLDYPGALALSVGMVCVIVLIVHYIPAKKGNP